MVDISTNTSGSINVTASNSGSVNVNSNSSSNVNANTNANAQRAKSWAVGTGLIDGEDYSAKYWAGQAKISEEVASNAIQGVDDAANQAIEDIETAQNEALENLETAKDEKITEIEETAIDYGVDLTELAERAETAADGAEAAQAAVESALDNYYTKSETYSQAEVQALIAAHPDETFLAEYDVTSYTEIKNALADGKRVFVKWVKPGSTSAFNVTYYLPLIYKMDDILHTAYFGGCTGSTIDTIRVSNYTWSNSSKTIPTKTSELTNDSGFITASALDGYATETWVSNQGYLTAIASSDVTTALGYIPYNSTNPDGYITASDLPTNHVTTDTAQDISGRKTFLGEKAIYFKQTATSNKLGFTLYNPSNGELGALEYRPNTINGASLLALNCPQTTGGYVGFRYWGTPAVNIVAPKVATAGNYFMATHITNGALTVTANTTGTVDISSLLPDVSNFVTNSSLSTTLADYTLSSSLATVATSGSYNDLSDKPYIPSGVVIDQTYDGTSTNAQSGVAIESELSTNYQNKLVSGTNIKSIGNQSLVGSGNLTIIPDLTLIRPVIRSTGTFYDEVELRPVNDGAVSGLSIYSTTPNTAIDFYIRNKKLYDGTTSLIPDNCISSNIARTSAIPTVPTNISAFTNDSGYLDGNDFKTINNTNIVGSGNISVQPTLVSGTNIKTINSTSLLGSGNINLPNMNNTTFRMYTGAKYYWYNNSDTLLWYAYTASDTPSVGDLVSAYDYGSPIIYRGTVSSVSSNSITISSNVTVINGRTFYRYSTLDEAGYYKLVDDEYTELEIKSSYLADTTLSNVASIDSNSAVQTALNTKVNKSGDTMTGELNITNASGLTIINDAVTKGTTPSSTIWRHLQFVDSANSSGDWSISRLGILEQSINDNGSTSMLLSTVQNAVNSTNRATLTLTMTSAGVASCTFPNTTCVDGQFVSLYQEAVGSTAYSLAKSTSHAWTFSNLPAKNCLVWVSYKCSTSQDVAIYSDLLTGTNMRATGTASGQAACVVMPVSSSKKIYLSNLSTSTAVSISFFRIFGYRVLGSNVNT